MKHIKKLPQTLPQTFKIKYGLLKPKVGDFVIMKDRAWEKINEILPNMIGKISTILIDSNYDIIVEYKEKDIPQAFITNFNLNDGGIHTHHREFNYGEILFYSKNKKDLIIHITTNKYNL